MCPFSSTSPYAIGSSTSITATQIRRRLWPVLHAWPVQASRAPMPRPALGCDRAGLLSGPRRRTARPGKRPPWAHKIAVYDSHCSKVGTSNDPTRSAESRKAIQTNPLPEIDSVVTIRTSFRTMRLPDAARKQIVLDFIGGADADRTRDLLNAIQALSQTELQPHRGKHFSS